MYKKYFIAGVIVSSTYIYSKKIFNYKYELPEIYKRLLLEEV